MLRVREGAAGRHRRLYALDASGLEDVEGWLASLRSQWSRRLDRLGAEIARKETP